jgi:hypothetical protein
VLNYHPIVPKASIYVPKVMHKPVIWVRDTSTSAGFGHPVSIGTFAPRAPRSVACVLTHTVAICVKVVHAVMTNHYPMIVSLGTACLNDDMCSSRVCQDCTCVVVDQQLGSTCSKYDELCSSNACVEGICSHEYEILKSNDACTSDSSCVSGACGYDSYNSSALKLL